MVYDCTVFSWKYYIFVKCTVFYSLSWEIDFPKHNSQPEFDYLPMYFQ